MLNVVILPMNRFVKRTRRNIQRVPITYVLETAGLSYVRTRDFIWILISFSFDFLHYNDRDGLWVTDYAVYQSIWSCLTSPFLCYIKKMEQEQESLTAKNRSLKYSRFFSERFWIIQCLVFRFKNISAMCLPTSLLWVAIHSWKIFNSFLMVN